MTREEAIEILRKNRPTSAPRPCGMELCDAVDMAISALRQQEPNDWICTLKCTALMDEGMCSHGGLCCLYESQRTIKENQPLTLDELRKMDGEPVWWWNKSAKPVCTICVWDRFMDEPMFANYDWQSEDTLKLSKYKWLKKCGYKPYRQKPEEDT